MFWEVTESLLEGFWTTIKIFGLTLLMGAAAGAFIQLCIQKPF